MLDVDNRRQRKRKYNKNGFKSLLVGDLKKCFFKYIYTSIFDKIQKTFLKF